MVTFPRDSNTCKWSLNWRVLITISRCLTLRKIMGNLPRKHLQSIFIRKDLRECFPTSSNALQFAIFSVYKRDAEFYKDFQVKRSHGLKWRWHSMISSNLECHGIDWFSDSRLVAKRICPIRMHSNLAFNLLCLCLFSERKDSSWWTLV